VKIDFRFGRSINENNVRLSNQINIKETNRKTLAIDHRAISNLNSEALSTWGFSQNSFTCRLSIDSLTTKLSR
jgi:hypothetical protein